MQTGTIDTLNLRDLSQFGTLGIIVMDMAEKISELESKLAIPQEKPKYYSVSEAAQIMKCSHTSIYRLISAGCLKTLGGFRHKRISRESLENYQRQVTL